MLEREDVFFAMPMRGRPARQRPLRRRHHADAGHRGEIGPLLESDLILPEPSDGQKLKRYVHQIRAILNIAGIKLGPEFYVEYSHHYGIPNFGRTGCVLIDCVNREYCKKILVQLPGQSHPYHFHRLKEETFQVLWGEMYLDIDGEERLSAPRRHGRGAAGRLAQIPHRARLRGRGDLHHPPQQRFRLQGSGDQQAAARRAQDRRQALGTVRDQLTLASIAVATESLRSKSDMIENRRILAVVPARGGSKGIPLKNLREVGRQVARRARWRCDRRGAGDRPGRGVHRP